MPAPIGIIYETRNLINDKVYRGQHLCHKCSREENDCAYLGSGNLIQQAISKYGAHNFRRRTLAICYTRDELDEVERDYVSLEWAAQRDNYNLKEGGKTGRHSEIARKVMSEKAKARKPQWLGIKGSAHPLYGKKRSAEAVRNARAGMLEWHKNNTVSKSTRMKQRMRKIGKPARNKGVSPSEDVRRKMSESAKRRASPSISTRMKLSAAGSGRAAWNKGRKTGTSGMAGKQMSAAARKKISDRLKAYHQQRR